MARSRRPITVRPIALQGALEQVRYRKRDDGLRYKHDVEGKSDLWLVDANGQRGTLTMPRDGRPGWERDGGTYWLTNSPEKRAMRKRASSKRRPTTRRKAKRPPPKGYKSWSTYMASIRPNRSSMSSQNKGGTVATRKRRRRRHTKARRNPGVALRSNRPATRRRRYRRNPPAFSMGGIVGRLTDAGKGALFMVGGEAATRYVRKNLLGMADGQTVSTLTDVGVGIAAGLGAEKVFGRQAGRDVTAGVFASVLRGVAKNLGIPVLASVLGDAGGGTRYVIDKNTRRLVPISGYAGRGNGRLAGYAGRQSLTGDRDLDRMYGA